MDSWWSILLLSLELMGSVRVFHGDVWRLLGWWWSFRRWWGLLEIFCDRFCLRRERRLLLVLDWCFIGLLLRLCLLEWSLQSSLLFIQSVLILKSISACLRKFSIDVKVFLLLGFEYFLIIRGWFVYLCLPLGEADRFVISTVIIFWLARGFV